MLSTVTYADRLLGGTAPSSSLVRTGLAMGLRLLVVPLAVAGVLLARPDEPIFAARVLAVETLLIAALQVAISFAVVRKTPTPGIARALTPALIAGLVVTAGDVAGLSYAFDVPASRVVLSVFAHDAVLGVVLALPVVIVLRAASHCRAADLRADVDASAKSLIAAYRQVLDKSACKAAPWRVRTLLAHQLLRRHVRRTLETVQRGYATRAVERDLNEAETRDRQTIGDYLLAVPPISRAVPIPTVASIFLLWKLVPFLLAVAAMAGSWFGGGRWSLNDVSAAVEKVVPHEIAALIIDALALAIAFPLLMMVLVPAILKRDRLLAKYKVCEREVILMDDCLGVPRSSRRLEYVMAALPALPLVLFGGAVLVYALAGLFVYSSPPGRLGGLVERADVMHLGPVTGAVLAQAFLVAAAVLIAWIVKTRKTTRVVLL